MTRQRSHFLGHVNDLSNLTSEIINHAAEMIGGAQVDLRLNPVFFTASCSAHEWEQLIADSLVSIEGHGNDQFSSILGHFSRELVPLSDGQECLAFLIYHGPAVGEICSGNPEFSDLLEASTDALQIALELQGKDQRIADLEQQIEDRDTQYQSIADLLPNLALIECDTGGNVRRWNRAAELIYGYTTEEAKGVDICDLVVPAECRAEEKDHICRALLTGRPTPLERRTAQRKDGSTLTVLTSSAIIASDHGEPAFYRIDVDICRQLELEEKVRHVEKMDALGRLAGGVAHDFNNQLTGIIGLAELIGYRTEETDVREFAQTILSTAVHSADLASQLLAFSRREDAEQQHLDMHDLIREMSLLLERSLDKRIAMQFQFDAEVAVIAGDPSQLQTMLLNLAVNARDAMPEGGDLTFLTKTIDVPEATFRSQEGGYLPGGPYLLLSVKDTGSGIPLSLQPHIFEPFYTTKSPGKGTGIGLAAVYGTARAHGGTITVRSLPGKGATFELLFPLVDSILLQHAPAVDIVEEFQLTPAARILIVDDEDVVRQTAQEVLQNLGHQVFSCASGLQAVDHYRTEWGNIDLVILDMMMPQMSGKETFQALREINPKIKVLLASGYAPDGEILSVLDDGVQGFIQKPFLVKDLAESLGALLN